MVIKANGSSTLRTYEMDERTDPHPPCMATQILKAAAGANWCLLQVPTGVCSLIARVRGQSKMPNRLSLHYQQQFLHTHQAREGSRGQGRGGEEKGKGRHVLGCFHLLV